MRVFDGFVWIIVSLKDTLNTKPNAIPGLLLSVFPGKTTLPVFSKTRYSTETHLAIAGEGGVVKQEVGTEEEDDGVKHTQACPVEEDRPAEEGVLGNVPETNRHKQACYHGSHKQHTNQGGDSFLHLYNEGSLFSVSMVTCCSTRLYRRMGRDVKLMLYSVKYAVSYRGCRESKIQIKLKAISSTDTTL